MLILAVADLGVMIFGQGVFYKFFLAQHRQSFGICQMLFKVVDPGFSGGRQPIIWQDR